MVFTLTPNALTRKLNAAQQEPRLVDAALALLDNNLHIAEPLLRAHLKEKPHDIAAIRMMAELAGRIGRYSDAENLLRRALELAPDFMVARSNLATVLYRQNRPVEAVEELEFLLAHDPGHTGNANLKAAAHGRLGDYEEALALYQQVLAKHPEQPKVWMSYGHVLKTVGRQNDCIKAYRTALIHAPHLGEVWWSLANLKTVTFEETDIAQMTTALTNKKLDAEDKYHLHFALGKAHEEKKQPAISFNHYQTANMLRRDILPYDAQETRQLVARAKTIFTKELFSHRAGQGCNAPDPIFILGMPRAGSTLIEQILASHSQVEGTMELPDIPALAARIGARKGGLDNVSPAEIQALGEEYIERTRVQRKTDKPYFIDKLPNNWAHIGLIQLILPNAKIIDARRHPLASCFSNFKQHFARGQSFAYDLADLGHYYANYVELLAHFDAVLPNRIHRVIYENMVEDSDTHIRHLLAALNLSFEPACLTFFENDRAVRTASSEQVRRPINRDGMDQWQPFEPWLNPLKQALGAVLTSYPEAPAHFD
jgi:cytochrome c-type biogenesis protein CcmH/NrfG